MSGPSVYVAGSSREIPRVREAIRQLDAAGCVVVGSEWIADVERYGSAGADLTDEQRAACARRDLAAIDDAEAVLVLWPETPSVGAYVELGYALGRGRHDHVDAGLPNILIVGGDSIWHSHVRALFGHALVLGDTLATVEDAIEWMRHEMHVCGEWPEPEVVERMRGEAEGA